MPEKPRHKQLKGKDAHKTGKTEYVLDSGARLDALSPTRIASEIERGGTTGIRKSVSSLKEALHTGVARKARLRVPQNNMDSARK